MPWFTTCWQCLEIQAVWQQTRDPVSRGRHFSIWPFVKILCSGDGRAGPVADWVRIVPCRGPAAPQRNRFAVHSMAELHHKSLLSSLACQTGSWVLATTFDRSNNNHFRGPRTVHKRSPYLRQINRKIILNPMRLDKDCNIPPNANATTGTFSKPGK